MRPRIHRTVVRRGIAPLTIRKSIKLFGMQRFRNSKGICVRIANAKIHCAQSGGIQVPKPSHLNRSRMKREDIETIVIGVS